VEAAVGTAGAAAVGTFVEAADIALPGDAGTVAAVDVAAAPAPVLVAPGYEGVVALTPSLLDHHPVPEDASA